MEDTSIKRSTVITTLVVIVLLLGGTWAWVKYAQKGVVLVPPEEVVTNDPSAVNRINAKHQFKDGKHIIAGEVNLPTPCYVLGTQAVVAESYPEQVTIAFTAKTGTEVCTQVVTTERFKVDFTASKEATIKATWNGVPIILNLIPAGQNEDLANFELFIKG
jgi:hypothetical protein